MQQIILPYPINEKKLSKGSIEFIDLGPKTFKITIPKDLRFGEKLRLKGLGEYVDESFQGQDLILLLKKELETFTSIKKDILMELPIDLDSLKRKAVKRITIHDKKYDVKIPLSSSYGQTLRLKGIAEVFNGGYPGDVLLRIAQTPNEYHGVFHKIFGNFLGFHTPLSERTFKIVFKLPWLFEISDEYHFKYSNSSLHGNYE